MHSFVNIKTILGTSPDSYRRLVRSDLGSNCLQGLLAAIFCVTFGQTDLLKLYARVISSSRQSYFDKSICGHLRDYVTETVRNVCLNKNDEGFVYVIFDTSNPQNRALHGVLHVLNTGTQMYFAFLSCHPDSLKCYG